MDDALARGETVKAPSFTLERLSGGGKQSLADYRGKVVVLNAWASWCGPCRAESPLMERWHKRISRDGRGTVLGINSLDATGDARGFVREYGLTYPILRDAEGESLIDYGVVSYPETFVSTSAGGSSPCAAARSTSSGCAKRWRRCWSARDAGADRARRARRACAAGRRDRRRLPEDHPRRRRGRGDVPGLRHAARTGDRGAAGEPRAGADPAADRPLPLEGGGQGDPRRPIRAERARLCPRPRASTSAPTWCPRSRCCWRPAASRWRRGAGAAADGHRPPTDPTRTAPPASGSTPTWSATSCDRRRAPSTPPSSPRSPSASSPSSRPACCRSCRATCRRSPASRSPTSRPASRAATCSGPALIFCLSFTADVRRARDDRDRPRPDAAGPPRAARKIAGALISRSGVFFIATPVRPGSTATGAPRR